jgi:hypothetical protein
MRQRGLWALLISAAVWYMWTLTRGVGIALPETEVPASGPSPSHQELFTERWRALAAAHRHGADLPECQPDAAVRSAWAVSTYSQSACRRRHRELIRLLAALLPALEATGVEWHVDFDTLLGVVRHNGTLVPWERDVSIAVMVRAACRCPPLTTPAGPAGGPQPHAALGSRPARRGARVESRHAAGATTAQGCVWLP